MAEKKKIVGSTSTQTTRFSTSTECWYNSTEHSSGTPNQICNIYIRPYFDYCDAVTDGPIRMPGALRLEQIQSRAARIITGTMFRTLTLQLDQELGWKCPAIRREIHWLTEYHKLQCSNLSASRYSRCILPPRVLPRWVEYLKSLFITFKKYLKA